MKTNNHMLDLWALMEARNVMGITKMLYDPSFSYHIYATYASDERGYGISFTFPESIRVDTTPFQNLKKLKVSIYNDGTKIDSKMLLIQLLAPAQRDTFSFLCENLINSVKDSDSDEAMIKSVISQLDKWRNLFDKAGSEGLSPAEQQGLYGELGFLKKLISKNVFPASEALDYWVGVDAAQRDFMGDAWAVEVKTTATSNPQEVTINSERQLDETLFDNLYLYHCSVETTKQNGETLPDRINKLRRSLENEPAALSKFNEKLITAGYFDEDEALYAFRAYKLRDESIYRVEGDFPRIKESDLRGGVGNLTYSVVLSACAAYRQSEATVFSAIKNDD